MARWLAADERDAQDRSAGRQGSRRLYRRYRLRRVMAHEAIFPLILDLEMCKRVELDGFYQHMVGISIDARLPKFPLARVARFVEESHLPAGSTYVE